jgi:hypothetical protein
MPVAEPFRELLPDGMVRGQVMSCGGEGARSLAFGVVREALASGAWMAVVDVSTFGTDAAAELGIPLERVVRVDTGVDDDSESDGHRWIDVVGAAVDGFDVVLVRVPEQLSRAARPAAVRKLRTRIQQRGAVVVTLGRPGALGSDVELAVDRTLWSGVERGSGYLRQRRLDARAAGRRLPQGRTCSLELVGAASSVSVSSVSVSSVSIETVVAERDPQTQVLAEMTEVVLTDAGDDATHASGVARAARDRKLVG